MSNLTEIKSWLEKKTGWVIRARAKEEKTGEPTDLTLSDMLSKELKTAVEREDKAYAEALDASSDEELDEAIATIIKHREKASPFLYKTIVEDGPKGLICTNEKVEKTEEDDDKKPRKKGYLELSFEKALIAFNEEVTPETRTNARRIITQLEVTRRVKFLYDVQKLRMQSETRTKGTERLFGVKDVFMDYGETMLASLERQNERMLDQILVRSPDAEFYAWMRNDVVGLGVKMGGAIIGEWGAPERFRSVSAAWSYSGLGVVDGHAARREAGKTANWNNFLKSKLLGVLADVIVQSQTPYLGMEWEPNRLKYEESVEANKIDPKKKIRRIPDRDEYKARHVITLNNYKHRLLTKNDMVPQEERFYIYKKKEKEYVEIFQNRSNELVSVYDKDDNAVGEIRPCDVRRRRGAHINSMAKRYMIKMLVIELLNKWRTIKGFKALPTYDEAKLRDGVPHAGLRTAKPKSSKEDAVEA